MDPHDHHIDWLTAPDPNRNRIRRVPHRRFPARDEGVPGRALISLFVAALSSPS